MTLTYRFFIFVSIILFILLGSFIYQWNTQKDKLQKLNTLRVNEFMLTFEKIIELKVSKSKTYSYDYSYWDELIEFLDNKNLTWAQINLDESLKTFDSDAVYVFDKNNIMVYHTGISDKTLYSHLIAKKFNFDRPVFENYFVQSKTNTPIQIFIAPIQTSNDIKRIGKPQGYFIVAKVWTPQFIHEFEKITKQTINLSISEEDPQKFDLYYPLLNQQDKQIFKLGIKLNSPTEDFLNDIFKGYVTDFFLIALFGMLALMIFMYKYLFYPLSLITTAMQMEKSDTLSSLKHKKNEFAKFALLVDSFLHQKIDLERQLKRADAAEHRYQKLWIELQNTNTLLEQKVDEKTKDLAEINKSLDARVKTEVAHRREQERMLIHQARYAAMGEMIGNIAHQWRQPLNALSLLIQKIKITYEKEQINDDFIKRVTEKGLFLTTSMSNTIDDFRNFFKPNKQKENFSLSSQIKTSLLILEASLIENEIETIINLEQDDLVIYGFANEFSQVIFNIILNAKDALIANIYKNRQILIHGYCNNQYICLDIEDNAGGIDEGIIDRIFDPYFTTKQDGTGIGLYMSKVIIENHMGGYLRAKNNNIGVTFTICIPNLKYIVNPEKPHKGSASRVNTRGFD